MPAGQPALSGTFRQPLPVLLFFSASRLPSRCLPLRAPALTASSRWRQVCSTETSQRADIATDLDTTLKAVPGLGNLHNGFLSAYEAVHTRVRHRHVQRPLPSVRMAPASTLTACRATNAWQGLQFPSAHGAAPLCLQLSARVSQFRANVQSKRVVFAG